jgi:hypothetical protein
MSEFEFHISPACKFVSTPDRERRRRHKIEQSLRHDEWVVGHVARASDSLVNIEDDAVPPASDLVAKDPETPRRDCRPGLPRRPHVRGLAHP